MKKNIENYKFILYDDIEGMNQEIYRKNKKHGLSRMIAGYAWDWKTKNIHPEIKADKETHDIKIQNNYYRWNSKTVGWVLSDEAIDEIGSIHTIQGYDLNYAGVIIGPDLKYDKEKDMIVTDRDAYKDSKGKQQTTDEELDIYIKNIYVVLLTRAIKGTYVYVVDEDLRNYLKGRIDLYGENNKRN